MYPAIMRIVLRPGSNVWTTPATRTIAEHRLTIQVSRYRRQGGFLISPMQLLSLCAPYHSRVLIAPDSIQHHRHRTRRLLSGDRMVYHDDFVLSVAIFTERTTSCL
ncbi:hypothetical protein Dda3937_04565 [Dickeya dadantii 3937]|uniref:Uncharacterized protein n=1 Tax=Dickeya dadantii (strain 3937) TaxID=198628 RepID=E0SAR2_DICD3|nr:hypothetical protein Dda3937_04565 [Dickeya dadantii 3937]